MRLEDLLKFTLLSENNIVSEYVGCLWLFVFQTRLKKRIPGPPVASSEKWFDRSSSLGVRRLNNFKCVSRMIWTNHLETGDTNISIYKHQSVWDRKKSSKWLISSLTQIYYQIVWELTRSNFDLKDSLYQWHLTSSCLICSVFPCELRWIKLQNVYIISNKPKKQLSNNMCDLQLTNKQAVLTISYTGISKVETG